MTEKNEDPDNQDEENPKSPHGQATEEEIRRRRQDQERAKWWKDLNDWYEDEGDASESIESLIDRVNEQ